MTILYLAVQVSTWTNLSHCNFYFFSYFLRYFFYLFQSHWRIHRLRVIKRREWLQKVTSLLHLTFFILSLIFFLIVRGLITLSVYLSRMRFPIARVCKIWEPLLLIMNMVEDVLRIGVLQISPYVFMIEYDVYCVEWQFKSIIYFLARVI